MTLIPSTIAHSPAWQIPTYAYIVAAPNPVGVGQLVHIYMWLDPVYGAAGGTTAATPTNASTASAALLANNYRFQNYQLITTAPDGTNTTQTFPVISDTTSSQFTTFTPSQAGTYTLTFIFPGQAYGVNGNGWEKSVLINDTYSASSATTTLTVQQSQIPAAVTGYPLPQQYWSRPIYGENTNWWVISSNWLGNGAGMQGVYPSSAFATLFRGADAQGPLTGHVMWTRPLQFGGVVGGNQFVAGGSNPNGAVPGAQYFEGSSYQPRFTNPIIINGYLFYTEPVSFSGGASGPTDAVDIRTGQVLWSRQDVPPLSFGYVYNLWDPDQHGAYPPILVAINPVNGQWQLYDAYTGVSLFNVTAVPSSTSFIVPTSTAVIAFPNKVVSANVAGPTGEQLRYVIANAGTAANPRWYLAQWNMSKLWQYDINPYTGGGSTSPAVINASNGVLIGGAVVLSSGSGSLPPPITGISTGTQPNGLAATIPYGSTITVNADIPINAATAQFFTTYDWNISVPYLNTMPPPPAQVDVTTGQLLTPPAGTNPATIVAVNYGDLILCRNGTLPSGFAATNKGYPQLPFSYFAINLNASRGAIGSLLWQQTYNPPSGNVSVQQEPVDFNNRVFTLNYQETRQFVGYNLDTGSYIWGPTPSQGPWDYYGYPGTVILPGVAAYGNLYDSSFGGVCYAYNILTGELLWTYGNDGPGNSTNAGLQVFYGDYPTQIQSIGSGVIYMATNEHTMPNPFYKGCQITALNATTGKEIWKLSNYPSEWSSPGTEWVIADGYATFMNGLDNNIYSVGRGPSKTSIQAPQTGITVGSKVVIEGTVIDLSAGTKLSTQAANFPDGVPVASDSSMYDWMGYVYQQKPYPTNFTGVPVSIDALDPNGNYVHIDDAVTSGQGLFHYTWAPPSVPGDYMVYATFGGSNGYWPSSAVTAMTVTEAPSATAAPTSPPASMTDTYILGSAIAIIIVIIIIGAVILLTLRKRR